MSASAGDVLLPAERSHYRGLLRDARYAALADAEGFAQICFAVEALGLRLLGERGTLGVYRPRIHRLSKQSVLMGAEQPAGLRSFSALYEILLRARNDNMHIGAYARHATDAAIELCIGLEDALMSKALNSVGQVMVRRPITVEPWQPVAQARQLMLTHSFSFLPVRIDEKWHLVSEMGIARFLLVGERDKRLAMSIGKAAKEFPQLLREALMIEETDDCKAVLNGSHRSQATEGQPTLWLVADRKCPQYLAGVLSPFELM